MKYFELTGNTRYKFAPRLVNWYGAFDVRNIRIEKFYKLPKQHLFKIESSENTIFTDAVFFPFLLVSQMVRDVIKMYGDAAFYREIILLDSEAAKSQLYYLPVFEETSELQIGYKTFDHGICTIEKEKDKKQIVSLDRNIFWIDDRRKRHTIISQELAESLLMRNAIGIDLQEVILYR